MKVKDLILHLAKFHPETEVFIELEDGSDEYHGIVSISTEFSEDGYEEDLILVARPRSENKNPFVGGDPFGDLDDDDDNATLRDVLKAEEPAPAEKKARTAEKKPAPKNRLTKKSTK
jgi:nitrous oxide reductase